MKVKEILQQWLKDNGYDGLFCEYCGCERDDICPCDLSPNIVDCEPGYKFMGCNEECGEGCDWHITSVKEID